jgi:hypothetical protein
MGNQGTTTSGERRGAPRYLIVAPVDLGAGDTGWLCNMSTSGVLFQTDRRLALGEQFRFCWSLTDAAVAPARVCCDGLVVRIEQHGAACRVAASIRSVRFNPINTECRGPSVDQLKLG